MTLLAPIPIMEDFVRSLFSIKFFVKLPCDFVSLPYFVSRSSFDFDDTVLATEALNFNAYLSTVANPVHLPNPSLSGGLVWLIFVLSSCLAMSLLNPTNCCLRHFHRLLFALRGLLNAYVFLRVDSRYDIICSLPKGVSAQ